MKKSLLILLIFLSVLSNAQTISLTQLISLNKKFDINYSEKYLKQEGWVATSSNDEGINYANKYGDIAIISLYNNSTRITFTSAELRILYFSQIKKAGSELQTMETKGDVTDMFYKGELSDFIFTIKLLPKNKQIYSVTVCKLK